MTLTLTDPHYVVQRSILRRVPNTIFCGDFLTPQGLLTTSSAALALTGSDC